MADVTVIKLAGENCHGGSEPPLNRRAQPDPALPRRKQVHSMFAPFPDNLAQTRKAEAT